MNCVEEQGVGTKAQFKGVHSMPLTKQIQLKRVMPSLGWQEA
jgi:hypothetical protein